MKCKSYFLFALKDKFISIWLGYSQITPSNYFRYIALSFRIYFIIFNTKVIRRIFFNRMFLANFSLDSSVQLEPLITSLKTQLLVNLFIFYPFKTYLPIITYFLNFVNLKVTSSSNFYRGQDIYKDVNDGNKSQ